MRVLIDGYNVLFQSGLGGRSRGPGWIQRARDQLLIFFQDNMSDQWVRDTTVVFDKSQGKQSQLDHQTSRGLKILFAVEHDEADDLIEDLIKAHHSPKFLIVVSSDLRVRRQAMARRAQSIDSETFLRQLEDGKFRDSPGSGDSTPEASDRPVSDQPLTDDEVRYWLREFGDP